MAIDPNIALQYRGVELPNQLAQYGALAQIQGAQQANALRALQMRELEEGVARRNRLTAQLGAPEFASLKPEEQVGALTRGGFLTEARSLAESQSKVGKEQREAEKSLVEIAAANMKRQRDLLPAIKANPSAWGAWRADTIKALPGLANIIPMNYSPEAADALMLEADKALEQHFAAQNLGGTERVIAMPKYGAGPARVVAGSEAVRTLAPGEAKPTISNIDIGSAVITQEYDPAKRTTRVLETRAKTLTPEQARAAAQEAKKVAHTTTDERGNVTLYNTFGQIIEPKDAQGMPAAFKGKPSATFEKTRAQREQLSKDLDFAIKELSKITEDGGLIDQSTGSGAGRLADIGAGFFGRATPGAIAIGKIAPVADLALKMVPRFEGPQSDKDTASYKEAAGQLADPTLPTAIRKEAGRTVLRLMRERKNQFVTNDMAAEGTGTARAAGGIAPPPGFTPD